MCGLVIACNTPSRMAKGAVEAAREHGIAAGLLRPITLWPFPIDALKEVLPDVEHTIVLEASPGQLEDEMRLALSHAGIQPPPITSVRRLGGMLPQQAEILAGIRESQPAAGARSRWRAPPGLQTGTPADPAKGRKWPARSGRTTSNKTGKGRIP